MSYQGYQGGYGPPPPQQGLGYNSRGPQQGSGYGAPPNNGPPPGPPGGPTGGPGYGTGYNPGYNPGPAPGYGQNPNQNMGGPRPPARPPMPPNPANMDPQQRQLYYWFVAVDTDRSGVLEADELQRALINGDWSPFSIDTVRLMISMFDADLSGTIDFQEFCGLWRYIEDWKRCFRTFDRDGSGSIDRRELFDALTAFGFRVPTHVVDTLIKKMDMLGGVKSKTGRGEIGFDKFIYACVTVKTLTDSFRKYDTNNDGWIELNYENFLAMSISNTL